MCNIRSASQGALQQNLQALDDKPAIKDVFVPSHSQPWLPALLVTD